MKSKWKITKLRNGLKPFKLSEVSLEEEGTNRDKNSLGKKISL